MDLSCVLSNEVFYLELVQIATLLTGGHKSFRVHSCEMGTTMGGVLFLACAVSEQPAGTIELCVLVTGSSPSCVTKYHKGKGLFLYGLYATEETSELCVTGTIIVHSCETGNLKEP